MHVLFSDAYQVRSSERQDPSRVMRRQNPNSAKPVMHFLQSGEQNKQSCGVAGAPEDSRMVDHRASMSPHRPALALGVQLAPPMSQLELHFFALSIMTIPPTGVFYFYGLF